MKKTVFILVLLLSMISFFAFIPGKKQAPTWKNLQILPKDISKEKLDSVMDHFSISLGVKCNYCHTRIENQSHMDFASDIKGEKKIARKMMLMSDSINTQYFTKDPNDHSHMQMVTCYTCHRGQEQPETAIPDNLLHHKH